LSVYVPFAWAAALALAFAGLFCTLAIAIGPKRETAAKHLPFECGSDPIGSPYIRYSVKFYQVAILFLVFDIEAAFMYPWAVLYHDLTFPVDGGVSYLGFGEMVAFVAVLGVALAHVWRKKAIGWV
jgi:NADH-quinone oxidoreductase subunit A